MPHIRQAAFLLFALLLASGFARAEVATATASESSAVSTSKLTTRECLQSTGSHLPRSADQPCIEAPGEVHTREDIERTGAVTVGDALRRLSPSVRVGR
jgi:outer membrane cobalamin receptor